MVFVPKPAHEQHALPIREACKFCFTLEKAYDISRSAARLETKSHDRDEIDAHSEASSSSGHNRETNNRYKHDR
jgi:hypothetical protein